MFTLTGDVVWGTYRPNLYFGVKARTPFSPLMGLLWSTAVNPRPENFRHDAEERDKLTKYGWLEHNGETYGKQEILDGENNLNLTTYFIQDSQADTEGGNENDAQRDHWAVRFVGEPMSPAGRKKSISLFWYLALPSSSPTEGGAGSQNQPPRFELVTENSEDGSSQVHLSIDGEDVGGIRIDSRFSSSTSHPTTSRSLREGKDKNKKDNFPLTDTYYVGLKAPEATVWKAKDMVQSLMNRDFSEQYYLKQAQHQRRFRKMQKKNPELKAEDAPRFRPSVTPILPNQIQPGANVVIFQHVLELPFSLDIVLRPRANADGDAEADSSVSVGHLEKLTDASYISQLLQQAHLDFNARFESSFSLLEKGFDASHVSFAQAAMSNMLGGIGHFRGTWRVQYPGQQAEHAPVATMFNTVPSRSFFPRGFMWDEGFHQLLVGQWNAEISQDILSHWFSQVDSNGWLPREQILGDEARARVPDQFQIQRPHVANPPTLILAIHRLIQRINLLKQEGKTRDTSSSLDVESFRGFVHSIFPSMKRQIDWYYATQAAEKQHSYRWHGRTLEHALSSGLDDYPRAEWLTEDEGHLDLHAWMVLLAETMSKIVTFLAEDDASLLPVAEEYTARSKTLRASLVDLHWSDEHKMYCDYAMTTPTKQRPTPSLQHIPRTGYVTLFPMLLRLIPADSVHLKHTLDLLGDESKLWSPWGILSLSRTDKYFGAGENYWRGNIWINLNYLAVSSLYHYGHEVEGPYKAQAKELFTKLRSNLIENIYQNYQRTGYLWEQYSAMDGAGRKSHPFTGWTALIVLIMADVYV